MGEIVLKLVDFEEIGAFLEFVGLQAVLFLRHYKNN